MTTRHLQGFPGGSVGKESTSNVGEDLGLIPGLGRSLGAGHGSPLQCSCLENSMDRGAWWATGHGVDGHLGCFHVLAIVHSACEHRGACIILN